MRRRWTACELDLLASMYPECQTEDVAAWIGRTVGQCYQAAAARGLRKSAGYLASGAACRLRRGEETEAMKANRFQPGQAAWNKGLRGVVGVQEACRATQFKKGQMAGAAQHNYKPIGMLRINAEGALERKVTDDPSIYPARRWVSVARLVWEAERGPIPPGHIVRFKPGMQTTDEEQITADRLECITRLENMRRNTVHNYPPEVARLVQLRGALNRQINARTRAAEQA